MYNVTFRSVRVTTVAVENNKCYMFCVCVCVCSINCLAYKAHAQNYIAICGLPGCVTFSTLYHKRHDYH